MPNQSSENFGTLAGIMAVDLFMMLKLYLKQKMWKDKMEISIITNAEILVLLVGTFPERFLI